MQNERREYESRVNRVLDYIDRSLEKKLSLEELARVASFSPFHFHRIFKCMVGETLNDYIRRIKLEKAANILAHNERTSITEIAFDCGFSSSAVFARAFKENFGMSASEWRRDGFMKMHEQYHLDSNIGKTISKDSKIISKNGKDIKPLSEYFFNQRREAAISGKEKVEMEVKEMPSFHVIYVRYFGKYGEKLGAVWERLLKWAGPRGLITADTKKIGVTYDNPRITPESKLRYDACITIPEGVVVQGDIGVTDIAGGKYAVYRFQGRGEGIDRAFDDIYTLWFPQSGYQPDDRPSYHIVHSGFDKYIPGGNFIFDICIPVKPL